MVTSEVRVFSGIGQRFCDNVIRGHLDKSGNRSSTLKGLGNDQRG
jgi:hypothetical protein